MIEKNPLLMYARIVRELIPFVIGIVLAYFFWEHNILLTALFLAVTALVLMVRYEEGDIHAFILGTLVGLVVEIPGTTVSKYQSFARPTIYGIPIWLPFAWGYGLMMMKRIGTILKEHKAP